MMSLNIINFWKQEIKNNNNVQSVSITLTVLTSPLIMTPLQGKKLTSKVITFSSEQSLIFVTGIPVVAQS